MAKDQQQRVPVVPTRKAAGHASNTVAWSKPSSFFKDRRRQQKGGVNVAQTGIITDIQTFQLRDLGTIRLFKQAEKAGHYDDENMLLERLIQLLYKLPRHSRQGKLLTDAFITKLWSTLDHPQPSPIPTLMGHHHRHRTADGSNSNPYLPTIGAAGTAYARAVAPLDVQSPDMPDAGLVFDTLLSRSPEFRPHQCGISSMMFYLGVIITHDIFQTDSRDGGINLASSYLDLAPLYGNNWDEQKPMRQFRDGLLKPDCFAHKRVLTFPPACRVFLLMFNRFHNYVVTQLALINEGDRFKKPKGSPDSIDPDTQKAWQKYDEDLFQTGRLVTCGLYINIVLKDYVRVILGLNRTDSTWTIDPRSYMDRHAQPNGAPTGVGNQVSVEFNLLYRWHAILSKRDAEWTADEMRKLLGGKDPETATFHEMIMGFHAWEKALPEDPQQRDSVPGLERGADGAYDDDELVKILQEGIEDTAGSFGAHSTPGCLRPVEMLGILQARRWRVGTLNEFRAFIGLKRHETFEEINPDPAIAAGLKSLYGSPANVELYPGLGCEKTKPAMAPGSGVCVGYTASRAILSDAVALVRGDRFYTDDFTPKNLTNWGYAEVDSDLDVDSGNVMYKLIFGAFPGHFQRDSIYAHHPLVTPHENKYIFEGLKKSSYYSWDPPSAQAVARDIASESSPSIDPSPPVSKEEGVPAPSNGVSSTATAGKTSKKMPAAPDASTRRSQVKNFVTTATNNLLTSQCYAISCPSSATPSGVSPTLTSSLGIDVVAQVLTLTFVRLTASMFSLSLKATDDKRRGAYTEQQLSTILSVLYAAESSRLSPGRSYELRRQARDLVAQFKTAIVPHVPTIHQGDSKHKSIRVSGQRLAASQQGQHSRGLRLKIIATGGLKNFDVEEEEKKQLVDRVAKLVACSAMVPVLLVSESLDWHLQKGAGHMAKLREAAATTDDGDDATLQQQFLDGCSTLKSRSRAGSSMAELFPEGVEERDLDIYVEAMTAVFGVMVRLPGLRRAPGTQGLLKSVPWVMWQGQTGRGETAGVEGDEMKKVEKERMYMTQDRSSYWPAPTTMNVVWDKE